MDWEGAVITVELYHARSSSTRFIPVVFDPADQECIPEPLRGQTWHCLTSEPAYRDLFDALQFPWPGPGHRFLFFIRSSPT